MKSVRRTVHAGVLTASLLAAALTPPAWGARALLIGIDEYADPEIPALEGCGNDVRLMKSVLTEHYGFAESDIKTLIGSAATREALLQSIRDWLIDRSTPGEVVVFYYSGHGTRLPDQEGEEADGLDEALCPHDAKMEGAVNVVTDDEINLLLADLRDRRVTVLVDSCFSGSITRNLKPVSNVRSKFVATRGLLARPPVRTREVYLENVVQISAAQDNQRALEVPSPDGPHGGFTYYLAQGLSGAADADADGRVTNKEVFEYTDRMMRNNPDPQLDHRPRMEPDPHAATRGIVVEPVFNAPAPRLEREHGDAGGAKVLRVELQADGALRAPMTTALAAVPFVRTSTDGYAQAVVHVTKAPGGLVGMVTGSIGDLGVEQKAADAAELVRKLAPQLEQYWIMHALVDLAASAPSELRLDLSMADAERADYKLGEKIAFRLRASRAADVLLINVAQDGTLNVLYPNTLQPDVRIKKDEDYVIPPAAGDHDIVLSTPPGQEMVVAIASDGPLPRFESRESNGDCEGSAAEGCSRAISGAPMEATSPSRKFVETLAAALREQKQWALSYVLFRSHD